MQPISSSLTLPTIYLGSITSQLTLFLVIICPYFSLSFPRSCPHRSFAVLQPFCFTLTRIGAHRTGSGCSGILYELSLSASLGIIPVRLAHIHFILQSALRFTSFPIIRTLPLPLCYLPCSVLAFIWHYSSLNQWFAFHAVGEGISRSLISI